jgi:hypothetical protein
MVSVVYTRYKGYFGVSRLFAISRISGKFVLSILMSGLEYLPIDTILLQFYRIIYEKGLNFD